MIPLEMPEASAAGPDGPRPVVQEISGSNDSSTNPLPKGVELGPDGKPCRTCTSFSAWAALTRQHDKQAATQSKASHTSPAATLSPPAVPQRNDCPPDVEVLGSSTWTLLHSITAQYPMHPTREQQAHARQFVTSFSHLYPCWVCATDFRDWLRKDGNAPRVSSREDFGRWMCEAHNAVNRKLGKSVFDCNRWEERWRTGWKDGSCD